MKYLNVAILTLMLHMIATVSKCVRGDRSERLEVRCYRAGPRLSADLHPLHPHRHRGALQRSAAHPRHMSEVISWLHDIQLYFIHRTTGLVKCTIFTQAQVTFVVVLM